MRHGSLRTRRGFILLLGVSAPVFLHTSSQTPASEVSSPSVLGSFALNSGESGREEGIRQWLEAPTDLNGDGVIDYIDIFFLAGRYGVRPTRTPTPTVTATATPDPAQANLSPVGDVHELDVGSGTTTMILDFPTGRETYLVILRNEDFSGQSSEVMLADESLSMPSDARVAHVPSAAVQWRRAAATSELHWHPDVLTVKAQPGKAMEKPSGTPLVLGQQRSFDVYGGATVMATLRYLGEYGAVFVDDAVWMQGEVAVDQGFVDFQGEFFDTTTYPVISSVFGEPSDVNGDGHIAILFTTAATALGGAGFFSGGDLFERHELDPRFPTNTMEVLYISPPNTPGANIYEVDIPAAVAHEFQHLINFYYHSLVYGGRDGLHDEEKWLDEGLSHLAEDYATRFLQSTNTRRIDRFLNSTDSVGILADKPPPNSTQRGGEYLLCRYIADRLGDEVIQKLVKTGNQGIRNVEAATGKPFAEIIADWSRAIFLSELGINNDPKFNYTAFSAIDYAPGRWWGKPHFWNVDLTEHSNGMYFGPLCYALLSSGAFGFAVFRYPEAGTKEIDLIHVSGPKPAGDLIRLPDRFEYPDYIDMDFWSDLILDEPLLDVFTLGEPKIITGRSADGQALKSVRIMWWRSWQTSIGPDQYMYADIQGDRFTATILFDDPSDVGEWTLALRRDGATMGYNATIHIVEP